MRTLVVLILVLLIERTVVRARSARSSLVDLERKLRMTEGAIARVTQELTARGEDISERGGWQSSSSSSSSSYVTKAFETMKTKTAIEEEVEIEKKSAFKNSNDNYANYGSLNNHFSFFVKDKVDMFSQAVFGSSSSSSSSSSSLTTRNGSKSNSKNSDDSNSEEEADQNNNGNNQQRQQHQQNSCNETCEKYERCVNGLCKCPLLYAGENCSLSAWSLENEKMRGYIKIDSEKFEREKVLKCAMGVNHDPFKNVYEEKYGDRVKDKKMRVQTILRSRFIATTKESAPDLPDLLNFNTCAVVGSNGNVRNNENFGKEIDKHDVVIRFNDAPTVGYEDVVGSKTTIRIQNSDFCAKGERGSKDFGNEICMHYTASPPDKMCNKASSSSCKLVYPSHRDSKFIFWYWKMNKIKGIEDLACIENAKLNKRCNVLKISAGYYGIQLALNLCGSVDLYGFGTSKETRETKHYFVKKSAQWDRKGWSQRHHWSFERFCIDSFADGLIPDLRVHL
jgi:hypothetical protein